MEVIMYSIQIILEIANLQKTEARMNITDILETVISFLSIELLL